MPTPASVLNQGKNPAIPDKKNLTRTITAALSHSPIRRGVLSSRDKEFLSILSYAADNGICRLSHQELADRMGHCKPQAITKRLQKLERLGYLKRDGNHRSQKIHLFEIQQEDDQHSLTIQEHIWTRNDLSSSQKLLITVILSFPNVKAKNWTWWANRIGMDIQSYKLNLKKIILKFHPEPYKTLYGNPIRLYKEPYKTLYAIFGIVGSDLGKDNYPTDNKGHTPHLEVLNNPSSLEDKKNMHPTPIQDNPKPFDYKKEGYLKRGVRPPTNNGPIDEEILMELQNEVFQHRYITTHRSNDEMANAAKIIKALKHKNGLSSILDQSQINLIVQCMTSNGNRFTPAQVMDVLHHQFSDEERVILYERISNSMSPAYVGGKDKPKTVTLANAAYMMQGAPGFSRLVMVCLRPPQLKVPLKPTPVTPKDLELPLAIVKRFIPNAFPGPTVTLLREAQDHYNRNILPFQKQMNMTVGFAPWVRGFLEFAYNKATRDNPLHPGWLKPTAPTYQEWETSYKAEARWKQNQRELGAASQAHAENEETIEKIIIDMDEGYTEAELLERWPANLVEMAKKRNW